jgi:hypothetical protein
MERKQSTKRAKQQTETIAQDKAYEKHFKGNVCNDSTNDVSRLYLEL